MSTWPQSAIDGTATPACWHSYSCARCGQLGLACGRHYVGDDGHEQCIGARS